MSVSKFPAGALFTIPHWGSDPDAPYNDRDFAESKELSNQKHIILKSIKSPTKKVFETVIAPQFESRLKCGWQRLMLYDQLRDLNKFFGHNQYYIEEYNVETNEMSAGIVNQLHANWELLVS